MFFFLSNTIFECETISGDEASSLFKDSYICRLAQRDKAMDGGTHFEILLVAKQHPEEV